MMMVVTVMAVALHLFKVKGIPGDLSNLFLAEGAVLGREWSRANRDAIHGGCGCDAGPLPSGDGEVPGSGHSRLA
jgi:hypothetical protein